MAISFPSSPVAGTSIYQGGRQWTYDGTTWNLVLGGAYELYWTHTGTGGETTLSGASDNGTTLTYPLGGENVYLNGVLLYRGQDYTATTGSTIVLANPLALSDIVTVVSYPAVQMSSNNIAQTTEPTTYTPGMVWVNTAGNTQGLQLVRWKKTPNAGTTVLSGLADDGTTTLAYTAGYEEVYVNGILIVKGVDYTATNGTSITLTQATVTGDTVEVFNTITMGVTNTYTQSQSDARYIPLSNLGSSGSTLMVNSNASNVVWSSATVSKNFIINGLQEIDQRHSGASTTVNNALTYGVDRWFLYNSGATNATVQRVAGTNTGTQYAARVTGTWGGNYGSRLESNHIAPLAGKTVTFSGTIWGSTSIPTLSTYAIYAGSQDSYATNTTISAASIALTVGNTSTNFSVTFVVPSGAVNGMEIGITGSLGSGVYFDVSNLQLEIGSVATPFSRSGGTLQGELNACERYYERSTPGVAYGKYGQAYYNNSSSQVVCNVEFKTTKRVIPTSIDYANLRIQQNGIGALGTISAVSINIESTTKLADLTVTIGSGATNTLNPIELMNDNNTAGYLGFSAEL